MKKYAVIIGLVFTSLVFASCALKGGTIEVINESTYNASIAIHQGIMPVTETKTAGPGKKIMFSIEEDGTYNVEAIFLSGSSTKGHHKQEGITLLGGTIKTVRVKPD